MKKISAINKSRLSDLLSVPPLVTLVSSWPGISVAFGALPSPLRRLPPPARGRCFKGLRRKWLQNTSQRESRWATASHLRQRFLLTLFKQVGQRPDCGLSMTTQEKRGPVSTKRPTKGCAAWGTAEAAPSYRAPLAFLQHLCLTFVIMSTLKLRLLRGSLLLLNCLNCFLVIYKTRLIYFYTVKSNN